MEITIKTSRKPGNKQRKYGRAGRKPSHNRYNMEMRWIKNKAKRIAKQARKEAKKRAKLEAQRTGI
jgi:hypothetical protein